MLSGLHILLIDDSEDDREFFIECISEDTTLDWEITQAETGQEGINLLKSAHFDCVLIDYSLPGHNGLKVLEFIRNENAEVAVVMLTGQGSERIAVEAMKAGAQDYITKPEFNRESIIATIADAIQQRKDEISILQRANYDHLTGLAGRSLFLDRLDSAVARHSRSKRKFTLLFIDLNKFKVINDTFGHQVGDVALKHVAYCLQECTRDGDTIARLGGDEFVVILENLPSEGIETATEVVARIHERLASSTVELKDQTFKIEASIGAAIYPTDADTASGILNLADRIMYKMKKSGFE